MQGFTDVPTKKLGEDIFGLGRYISGLSSFIIECNTPMTIAIQGDWGSGKTSMMNMIKENLGDKIVPVWFNTWQFSQFNMGDQLPIFFMSSLIESFNIQSEEADKLKKNLNMFAKVIKSAAVVAADTFVSSELATVIKDGISKPSESSMINMANEISKIKVQFQECVNLAIEQHNSDRIVIFVDDLDRLHPSKAVELLEVLKLFLDCDNSVFVLAIDYSVVSQGVKEKYGSLIGEEKGKSFFDKIIQVPFKMPVAQYDVIKYVANMLANIEIECKEDEIGVYVAIIQSSIGCNPRAMKRLFNAFLLLTKIANDQALDTNWKKKVLFAILCLQLSFENVYNYVATNRKSINDNFLIALSDKEKFEAYEEVEILKKEFDLTNDDKINKLTRFMKNFNKVIDKDGDNEFSEDEIDDFISVLGFSTITSLAKDSSIEEDDERWDLRKHNRWIVKSINSKIKEKLNIKFSVYQSNKDSGEWKFYFSSGYKWFYVSSKPFCVDFIIKSELSTKQSHLEIVISARKNMSKEELFSIKELNDLVEKQSFIKTDRLYIKIYQQMDSKSSEFSDLIFNEVIKVMNTIESCYEQ